MCYDDLKPCTNNRSHNTVYNFKNCHFKLNLECSFPSGCPVYWKGTVSEREIKLERYKLPTHSEGSCTPLKRLSKNIIGKRISSFPFFFVIKDNS